MTNALPNTSGDPNAASKMYTGQSVFFSADKYKLTFYPFTKQNCKHFLINNLNDD